MRYIAAGRSPRRIPRPSWLNQRVLSPNYQIIQHHGHQPQNHPPRPQARRPQARGTRLPRPPLRPPPALLRRRQSVPALRTVTICSLLNIPSWLAQWKAYVGYDQLAQDLPPHPDFASDPPSKINQDLILEDFPLCFKYPPLSTHIWNVYIRPDLEPERDYHVLTEPQWAFFKTRYANTPIPRALHQGQPDVNLLKFQATLLTNQIVAQIFSESLLELDKEYLQASQFTTLQDYYKLILKTVPTFKGNYDAARLWKYTATKKSPFLQLYQDIFDYTKDFSYNDEMIFEFQGQYLSPDSQDTIQSLALNDDVLIVIEFKDSYRGWCIKSSQVPYEAKCENCYQIKVLTVSCSCKKAHYCSQECKLKDETYHSQRCEGVDSDDETVTHMKPSEKSVNGLCGLVNIGNTCFMNSGLQCLMNTQELKDYFLENKYLDELNVDNPLGTGGQLVKKFANLLKRVCYGERDVINPISMKQAVGKFQPMFKGFQQHDSSELINFLLDGIHEDLNRIKKKPYIENSDYTGQPDFQFAKENWHNFTQRNQSIIVDNMYGQYKSKLVCPDCSSTSITFDPYLIVQIGIPQEEKKQFKYNVCKWDSMNQVESDYYQFSKKNVNLKVKDFKEEIGQKLGVSGEELATYISSQYYNYRMVEESENLNELRKAIKNTSLTVRQMSKEEAQIEKENVVFIPIVHQEVFGHYGYKKTISNIVFFGFSKKWSLRQVHLYILQQYAYLFQEAEEQKQDYEAEILKKVYSVQYRSNSTYFRDCYFCKTKQCDDCEVPFSDETTLQDVLELVDDMSFTFEFHIVWNKSPVETKRIEELLFTKTTNRRLDDSGSKAKGAGDIDLMRCLQYSQEPEQLGEDNAWYCKQCQNLVQAYKSMILYKAPKILILSLKRFKSTYKLFKSKLETNIAFPLKNLDLSDFVMNSSLPMDYQTETDQDNGETSKKKMSYDLYAVVNHYGGLGGGHYTAFIKNKVKQKWYHFEDNIVSEVEDESKIQSKAAYVLFYERREEGQEGGQEMKNEEV